MYDHKIQGGVNFLCFRGREIYEEADWLDMQPFFSVSDRINIKGLHMLQS